MTETSPAHDPAAPKNDDIRVETEETGALLRTVRREVEKRRSRKDFNRAYRERARSANVKGIRRGKVPRPGLEKP